VTSPSSLLAQGQREAPPADIRVTCASEPGERRECAADTSKGVVLARSSGASPSLLGKSRGYTDTGVWGSDGCNGEFIVGAPAEAAPGDEEEKKATLSYIPNAGRLLVSGEKGEMYVLLFSDARYLNQKGLDATFTDAFGRPVADRFLFGTDEVAPADQQTRNAPTCREVFPTRRTRLRAGLKERM
jgi:hypothetical protein